MTLFDKFVSMMDSLPLRKDCPCRITALANVDLGKPSFCFQCVSYLCDSLQKEIKINKL